MIYRGNRTLFYKYTITFILTALIAFSCFIIYDKSFIWKVDGFLTQYPFIAEMRHIIKDVIINHKFDFWLPEAGLGADTIGTFSNFFTDPFYYIAAAFPVQYADIGYSVAFVLKMYVAGLTIMSFLRYHKVNDNLVLIGGISYAFCNWAVGVIYQEHFLMPLILFPLLILGVDKVCDGESPATLIISITFSLITFIYFAYMSAVSVLVYLIVKLCCERKNEWHISDIIRIVLKLVGCICLACCIAAPIIVSMYSILSSAPKSTGVSIEYFPTVKELLLYIPSFTDSGELFGNYSYVGINALFTALLPLVFLRGVKNKRTLSIVCAFFLVMIIIPIWGILMNGFSYRVGRWQYISAFFFVSAIIEILNEAEELTATEIRVCFIWILIEVIAILIAELLFEVLSSEYVLVILWNLFFGCILVTALTKIKRRVIFLLSLNIGLGYCIIFSPNCINKISSFEDRGACYKAYSQSLLKVTDAIKTVDSDLYRIDFADHVVGDQGKYQYICTPSNESLFWRSNTLSGYFNTFTKESFEFNNLLLNSSGNFRRIASYSNDDRCRLNYLTNVKYHLSEANSSERSAGSIDEDNSQLEYGYEDYGEKSGVCIRKNMHDTSIGYLFNECISKSKFEEYSPLEREQLLMKYVVLDDEQIENDVQIPSEFDIRELKYRLKEGAEVDQINKTFEVGNQTKAIELGIEDFSNSELFVEIDNLEKVPYSKSEEYSIIYGENGDNRYNKIKYYTGKLSERKYGDFEYYISNGDVRKRIIMAEGDAQGFSDVKYFMSNLGYREKGDGLIRIEFMTPGKYSYDDIKVYAVPVNSFHEQADKLAQRKFEVSRFSGDHIKGTINNQDDEGILFLNVPYNKGWTAYVDGDKTDILKTDISFSGIKISHGVHEVQLIYRPIYMQHTTLLMMVGLVVFVLVLIRFKKRKKQAE